MPGKLRACDAAIEVLRETDNPAVMWGDHGLLHLIAERLEWEHDSWKTADRVLRALSRTPGDLVKRRTKCHGRWVLIFLLPEEAERREEERRRIKEMLSDPANF